MLQEYFDVNGTAKNSLAFGNSIGEKRQWVTPRLHDLSSERTESGGLPTVNESSLAGSFSSHDFAPDS
jgi:hypothetical protein